MKEMGIGTIEWQLSAERKQARGFDWRYRQALRYYVKISATAATRLKTISILLWDFEDLIRVNYEFQP